MGFVWRALVVAVVFAGVGILVDRAVVRNAERGGAPISEVRLSGAMAGLFAGGAIASVVVLGLAFRR